MCVYGVYEGGNKNPRNCHKKFIKIFVLYKSETLATFKALPLWLDAAIPASPSLLETLSKIFNWNAVKGLQRFSWNPCNVNERHPCQILVYGREQKKSHGVRWGEWGGGGLGHNHHFVFNLTPTPQPEGPGYPYLSGSSPLTCPAWQTLPVAVLPPA